MSGAARQVEVNLVKSIRVLLVDEQRVVREALQGLLNAEEDVCVVGQAVDGQEALDVVAHTHPDVVVMEVGMHGMNGVEAAGRIASHHPRVSVVALSAHAEERYVLGMLEAGARGYVLKSAAPEDLLRGIRAASAGKSYLSPEVASLVVGSYVRRVFPTEGSARSILAPREREVLQLVSEGHSSKDIARELAISVRTVETHRKHIMEKLDLHSVADLTRYAIREGLSPLE